MLEKLLDLLGDIYWNPLDWLPWIGIQILLAASIGVVLQLWLKRGVVAFLIVLIISFSANFSHLPKPLLSANDVSRINAKLPPRIDGMALTKISFAHRYLTYHFTSSEKFDPEFLSQFENERLFQEGCQFLDKWLASGRIKRVEYVFEWPGGSETRYLKDRDCKLLPDSSV
jgi:hypothetical protein